MSRVCVRFAAVALMCEVSIVPATLQAPDELEKIEPGRGKVQFQLQSVFGSDRSGKRDTQSFGIAHGLSDRLVIGAEVAGERAGVRIGIDEVALSALYRLVPPSSAAELAIGLAAAITDWASSTGQHCGCLPTIAAGSGSRATSSSGGCARRRATQAGSRSDLP